jgi:hypothetical protein
METLRYECIGRAKGLTRGAFCRERVKVLIAGDLVDWKDSIGHGLFFARHSGSSQLGRNRPNYTRSTVYPISNQ